MHGFPLQDLRMLPIPAFLYRLYESVIWREIRGGAMPAHIGVIVDGNRRYAKAAGLGPLEGHESGARKLFEFMRWCWQLDIRVVTLYGFSTENFLRSSEEVDHLMGLFLEHLRDWKNKKEIFTEKVKVNFIGRREELPDALLSAIRELEELTADHDQRQITVALGYGGRTEIVDAVKDICGDLQAGRVQIDDIDESCFESYLYTSGTPDPDLIIRTSGEERLSGFLLWQSAYSELYFTDVFWPAFRKIDFWRAIRVYQQRERRYGK